MKDLLFIDHIYHKITKNSVFFVDILKRVYNVDIIYFDPYNDMMSSHERPMKGKYDVVVLWQILLERDELDSMCAYDIGILVPMYDDYISKPHANWYQFFDYKVLCFSRTLYELVSAHGFDAKYFQFFFKPSYTFNRGSVDSAFFWQRISALNCNTVERLLENTCIKHLHIHRALDPNNNGDDANQDKFVVSYSEWFENESEMVECMNESAVYIAPRFYEGIGMSFLKAMACGRCVIAADYPTMNEYIIDGYNGVLWREGKSILLSPDTIRRIQNNTIEYMTKGYGIWNESIDEVLNWISKKSIPSEVLNAFKLDYLSLELDYSSRVSKKYEKYFECLYNMIQYNATEMVISDYLSASELDHVAVYGIGKLCEALICHFLSADIVVDYLIDATRTSFKDYKVYSPNEHLPDTDLIIVTVITEFDSIKNQLDVNQNVKIISLETLLGDALKKWRDDANAT